MRRVVWALEDRERDHIMKIVAISHSIWGQAILHKIMDFDVR